MVRGTRVPIARIVNGMAGGMTAEEVQRAYGVSPEDVRAALEFAADLVEQEELYMLPQ